MLKFKSLSTNLNEITKYINYKANLLSDISLGFLLMWRKTINARYAIYNDTLIFSIEKGEGYIFSYPLGKDIDGILNELVKYIKKYNLPLRFYALNNNELNYLKDFFKDDELIYTYDNKYSDYIYSFESQLNFSGKKFKGQRNHINKFNNLYSNVLHKPITINDIDRINNMLKKYNLEHKRKSLMEKKELLGTKELINNFLNYNLVGTYIEYNNEIISFTIGEIINDLLIIHVEKALTKYEGIYPKMYNSFINYIYTINKNIKYINREDNSGDLGIRMSKEQYHPINKEIKYQLHINKNKINIKKDIILKNDNIRLSLINENDKLDYYKLDIDDNINKYYGYDYKKDIYLDYPINEDSFYNSLLFDMNVSDSINFKITFENKLVGEIILWHITYNMTCEVGIRILSEYQNKGIGKKAFYLLSKYAYNELKLKPLAKCYKENKQSYNMILKSNYKLVKEDKKYYYFEYKITV